MRPLAAVAASLLLLSAARAAEVGTPLEREHKAAAEQIVGATAGQGTAAAASAGTPVAGNYGLKPAPAATPGTKSSPQFLPPSPTDPKEKEKEKAKPTTGQMAMGFVLATLGLVLALDTGRKLIAVETRNAPEPPVS